MMEKQRRAQCSMYFNNIRHNGNKTTSINKGKQLSFSFIPWIQKNNNYLIRPELLSQIACLLEILKYFSVDMVLAAVRFLLYKLSEIFSEHKNYCLFELKRSNFQIGNWLVAELETHKVLLNWNVICGNFRLNFTYIQTIRLCIRCPLVYWNFYCMNFENKNIT